MSSSGVQEEGRQNKFGESGMARHFFECNHQVHELRWQIIEQVYSEEV